MPRPCIICAGQSRLVLSCHLNDMPLLCPKCLHILKDDMDRERVGLTPRMDYRYAETWCRLVG